MFFSKKKKNKVESSAIGRMAVRNQFQDIKKILIRDSKKRPVFIDGGAFNGSTINNIRKIFPKALIYSFEANPQQAKLLMDNYQKFDNIRIYNCAIGFENRKGKFYITNYGPSSSLYQPNELNQFIHKDKMDIKEEVEIDIRRLDSFEFSRIDVVKLDLQGFELEALKGMGNLLENVKIILTEVEFVALYRGQSLFPQISNFLEIAGFFLYNFYDLYTHPKGLLTAGDAIFLNSKFYYPTDFIN
jgi:FkbM family methyltransferase